MRTDERAGQAAKYMLRNLEDKLQLVERLDSDGSSFFMTPDQKKEALAKIALLKEICGTD